MPTPDGVSLLVQWLTDVHDAKKGYNNAQARSTVASVLFTVSIGVCVAVLLL